MMLEALSGLKSQPPSPSAFQANPGPTERVFGNPPVQGRSFEMPWRPSKTWASNGRIFLSRGNLKNWMTPMSRFLPHKSVPYWHRKSQPRHRGLGKTVVSGGFVFDWFWLLEMENQPPKSWVLMILIISFAVIILRQLLLLMFLDLIFHQYLGGAFHRKWS